jgi:plasmid stability protein
MSDLLIRNVPKTTLDGLKARARRHHRSLQAEALDLLERSALPAGDGMLEWLAQARKPGIPVEPGLAALRESREER